ncbi:unnamed protein product [Kluyveromyces dobzhanskii CBS 2104]|uniref:WGS project CCBQ000000000 data, contig 00017 n=1 Tax=Kluyveromyces dobzhanskii CBS 2104 TaxID=1427455 RepID=A0A0A8L6P5_9SACH|nr:unnamed protein product [Kluyveromyces dobzhanskii CBS 2104]
MSVSGTVASSTINLVKTIVGAGLLAIPYAFRADGILLAVSLALMAAFTSGYGLFILAKCSKTLLNPRHSSFFTLCSITYPNLSLLFDFAMFIQCFGVCLSYLILIGDLFPTLFGGTRTNWVLLSTLIVIPLSLLRHLDSLRYTSILGLLALSYIGLLIILTYFFGNFPKPKVDWITVSDNYGVLTTFSIIVFAFTGSMNLFSIINELKENSMTNIKKIINYSISISASCFIISGLFGYLTFGENTLGNIILNYNSDKFVVKVARFNLGLMVLLSFPLLFHPCRISANNMVHWLQLNYGTRTERNESTGPITLEIEDDTDREYLEQELGSSHDTSFVHTYQSLPRAADDVDDDHIDERTEAVPLPDSRFLTITSILLLVMYVLAMNVQSFALVLALVGATGSTAISFTLPGLFGWKLIGTEALMNGERIGTFEKIHRYGSLALSCYGIVVMVSSVYITLFV